MPSLVNKTTTRKWSCDPEPTTQISLLRLLQDPDPHRSDVRRRTGRSWPSWGPGQVWNRRDDNLCGLVASLTCRSWNFCGWCEIA